MYNTESGDNKGTYREEMVVVLGVTVDQIEDSTVFLDEGEELWCVLMGDKKVKY